MYAPGWYQDPTQRFWQRYHDGSQWTPHVVGPTGQQGTDPVAVDLAAIPPMPVSAAVPPASSTNGMAIASMVLGILWIYWIGSILAVIFGFVAKRQIAASQGRQTGGGMATAGLVLGFVGLGVLAIGIVAAVVIGVADESTFDSMR